jgi:hypothetical protein
MRIIRLKLIVAFALASVSVAAAQTTGTQGPPPAGQSTQSPQSSQPGGDRGGQSNANQQPPQNQGGAGAQRQGQQGQTSGGNMTGEPSGTTGTMSGQVGSPVRGAAQSIPGAARVNASAPTFLSLEQAIQIAIENNLSTLLAHERKREAEGF